MNAFSLFGFMRMLGMLPPVEGDTPPAGDGDPAEGTTPPADGTTPEIFGQFQSMLGGMELDLLGRYEFYDACCLPGVRLAISTGEKRNFANILVTIGVA